ncbi:MAG: heterodisulfide reductase-related iron-sulfur binding cluster [Promethearchaeota archaeon]
MIQLRSDRMKEAEETDADYMVSACVFCKNNLSQAAKEDESALEVMDIIEILQEYTFYK